MHRIDGPAAAPGGQFTDGDPGIGTPATVVTEDWLNAVQEEIANVIEGAGISLSKPNNNQLLAAVRALTGLATPPGAVQAFARPTAPDGWLIANGALVARNTYPALFAAIGVTFGAGDGSTTFRLPDLRGEFIRGWVSDGAVDAGRAFGSNQEDELKSHTHPNNWQMANEAGFMDNRMASGNGLDPAYFQLPTGATGGPETRPRNVALLYCIKT